MKMMICMVKDSEKKDGRRFLKVEDSRARYLVCVQCCPQQGAVRVHVKRCLASRRTFTEGNDIIALTPCTL